MHEPPPESPTFESSLAALERMVRELEDGQLGLEDALARYEDGVGLIKHCYNELRQAEQRILLLTGASEDGQPLLQPFQHEATGAPKDLLKGVEPSRRSRKKPEEMG